MARSSVVVLCALRLMPYASSHLSHTYTFFIYKRDFLHIIFSLYDIKLNIGEFNYKLPFSDFRNNIIMLLDTS